MKPTIIPFINEPARLKSTISWSAYTEGGRENAEIHYLYREEEGPRSALVKLNKGSRARRHRHEGCESILVLEGSLRDEHGHHQVGSLVIFPPGSEHRWESEEGALLYITWTRGTVAVE